MKAEKIRDYYLRKLKEAEENLERAEREGERDNWRRIILGYQYLVDLRRVESPDDKVLGL